MNQIHEDIPEMLDNQQEVIPFDDVYQQIQILSIKRMVMTQLDRELFFTLQNKCSTGALPEEDKVELSKLFEMYGSKETGVWEELKDILPDDVSTKFVEYQDIEDLRSLYPQATFSTFENHVGNWKKVVIMELNGHKYVLKRGITHDYEKEYQLIQKIEKRPDLTCVELSTTRMGLFDFIGTEVMDFLDIDQMKQLIDLAIASSRALTSFDPNPGNLLVDVHKQIAYVDAGLSYTGHSDIVSASSENFFHLVQNIEFLKSRENQYVEYLTKLIYEFVKKVRVSNFNFSGNEKESDADIEELVRDELRHILRRLTEENKDILVKSWIAAIML